jgi:aminoglycoside phosphotransferase (APT) family kinase protein
VAPYLNATAAAWVEARLADLARLAPPSGAVVTHGDLWSHHLLLDADDHLCGVIDFGLASAFDAAWDFRSFTGESSMAKAFGPGFAERVLEHYAHPLDPQALERAAVYDSLDSVGDAYYEVAFLGAPGEFMASLQARA